MLLLKVHNSKAVDFWPEVQKAIIPVPGLVPEAIYGGILDGRIDLLLSKEPKVWFFARSLYQTFDPNWRLYYILCGWALDKLEPETCKILYNDLEELAIGNGDYILEFNIKSLFLNKFVEHAGGQPWRSLR